MLSWDDDEVTAVEDRPDMTMRELIATTAKQSDDDDNEKGE